MEVFPFSMAYELSQRAPHKIQQFAREQSHVRGRSFLYGNRIDVSGNWNVSAGPITFLQNGSNVTGTVGTGLYAAKFTGTLNQSVLAGSWKVPIFPALSGRLHLQFSPDGRTYQGFVSFGGQNYPVHGQRT